MKKRLFLTLINLFYFIGELLIYLVRWVVFSILSPWIIYKSAQHGRRHKSFMAFLEMMKWISDEYWILKK